MARYGNEKQKEQVCGDSAKDAQGIAIKPDCKNELRRKVAQEIEATNLCYNCETGFHYMKQV